MRKRKKVFNILPLGKIIPNLATLSALFVGITQVKFALSNKWEFAVICVVIASFLDAADGRLARFFNSCSRFGAELDSLSDFAVFGICPAITMYLYSLSHLNRLGWIISVLFAICMCLRLARFNTNDIENIKNPLSGKFFTGVPAPAGAILAIFPIILYNAFGLECFRNPYFCSINVIISAILCISKIPTLSIKKFHIKKEQYTLFLLGSMISIGIFFTYTWKAFSIFVITYIISIFFCIDKAKKIMNHLNNSNHLNNLTHSNDKKTSDK